MNYQELVRALRSIVPSSVGGWCLNVELWHHAPPLERETISWKLWWSGQNFEALTPEQLVEQVRAHLAGETLPLPGPDLETIGECVIEEPKKASPDSRPEAKEDVP